MKFVKYVMKKWLQWLLPNVCMFIANNVVIIYLIVKEEEQVNKI